MPKYVARLEAQDGSGHYRRSAIQADTVEEARAILEQREQKYASFQLNPADLDELEAKEAALPEGARLAGKERAQLAFHRQALPYTLVSIEEEVA